MNLANIIEKLDLKVLCGEEKLEHTAVSGGYVGDLLSDVMANGKAGQLWITRQPHQNIIAVASLKDMAGIILVQGKEPEADTLRKAQQEGIPLFTGNLQSFEIAGQLYALLSHE